MFHFDIDKFHDINNTLGHQIGDAVLMDVAARMSDEAKLLGTAQIFRIGGDEFVVVCEGVVDRDAAIQAAARFTALFLQPLHLLGHEVVVTFTIGAVLCPKDAADSSEALRNIDLALGMAKRAGEKRQTCFFHNNMLEELAERTKLIGGLRQALERDAIEVHYQALVDLRTEKVVGFEALARWNDGGKFISPAVFIPVAERAGLIPELGLRVLMKSAQQAKAWFDETGLAREVSVNVSAAQLMHVGFVGAVAEVLKSTALPPQLLCLELTESVFVGRAVDTIRVALEEIKAMGVQLALDDFGTGYSSLGYLEALPFDKLKIDRSFLLGVHKSAKKMDTLRNIVKLAHDLDLIVVAEGAETQDDLDVLRTLRADIVQGYVLSRPKPAVEAWPLANAIDEVAEKNVSRRGCAA